MYQIKNKTHFEVFVTAIQSFSWWAR